MILAFLSGCQQKPLYKDTQVIMGTFVQVTSPDQRAQGIVFAEFKRLDELLSKYKPDSEVSKLNQKGELKVSAETFYLLEKAKEFWQKSGGAFDITVGPLMDIWGFSDKKFRVPEDGEIKAALKLVGMDKIVLDKENNVVKFMLSGIKIDLGGIAKGYALDRAIKKLKEAGISSCLINAGGQVYCLGKKSGRPWKVAIRSPGKDSFAEVLELADRSASTSGGYEQYFIHDGKRYSHLFDPRSGLPADSGLASVTAVASEGLTADAISTAVFVLGKAKGEALAKGFSGVEVMVIEDYKDDIY